MRLGGALRSQGGVLGQASVRQHPPDDGVLCYTHLTHLQGTAGSRPAIQELLHALQSHSLFVYFGHGSGEQYLPLSSLRKLKRCAANLLMGCSSGRLRQHGEYGASGAVLEYLSAGRSLWHGCCSWHMIAQANVRALWQTSS